MKAAIKSRSIAGSGLLMALRQGRSYAYAPPSGHQVSASIIMGRTQFVNFSELTRIQRKRMSRDQYLRL